MIPRVLDDSISQIILVVKEATVGLIIVILGIRTLVLESVKFPFRT
jgi:hypothetical protein